MCRPVPLKGRPTLRLTLFYCSMHFTTVRIIYNTIVYTVPWAPLLFICPWMLKLITDKPHSFTLQDIYCWYFLVQTKITDQTKTDPEAHVHFLKEELHLLIWNFPLSVPYLQPTPPTMRTSWEPQWAMALSVISTSMENTVSCRDYTLSLISWLEL